MGYPNDRFADHDLVRRNCDLLGLPVPEIAWLPPLVHNLGSLVTELSTQAGSQRRAMLDIKNAAQFTYAANGRPAMRIVANSAYNQAYLTPVIPPTKNLTALIVVTPLTQANAQNTFWFGMQNASDEWAIRGNQYSGGTDYYPFGLVKIGGTYYFVRDNANQWTVNERMVLVMVRDDTSLKLYRNGVLVAESVVASGDLESTATNTYIGSSTDNSNPIFSADADFEVAMWWNEALNADQVSALSADPLILWEDIDDDDAPAFFVDPTIFSRAASSTWSFSHVLTSLRSLTLRSTWSFSQVLNTQRRAAMENVWNFRSVLSGTTATQWIQQTWRFTSSLYGSKSPIKLLSHTWTFTQNLVRTIPARVANTVTFTQTLATNIFRNRLLTSTWSFRSVIGLNFSLNKLFTNTWSFISAALAFKDDEGCEPSFTPVRPLQANEDDVLVVYLIGPLPIPTLAVQLKRPEYGNNRRQSLQVRVNRTRGGTLKVHARTPTYEPQTVAFQDLSLLKLEQVRDFLRTTKGKKIYYIDEQARKWEGYIISSDVDLAIEARDRGGAFTMDFEGRLV